MKINLTNRNTVGKVVLTTGSAPLAGASGSQGSQGFQGTQGAQGVQGAQGLPGTAVAKGDQGYQGIQGSQGYQGYQGEQGTPGTAVAKGDQGYQGVQGAAGSQGIQGAQGSQGTPGTSVAKGDKGEQGTQGVQGAQGYQGVQGQKGQKGDKGNQGDQGDQGVQGQKGDKGAQGSIGAQGTIGVQGSQGVQGAPGYIGNDGEQGAQGFQGRQGQQGTQGYQGRQGAQGVQGAIGIQGAQGDVGPQGVQGSTGLKGQKGDQGVQGSKGNKGDDVNSTAAYNQANAAYTQANSGYTQANSAYNQANSAYTQANSAYNKANSASTQANAAYVQANNAYTAANNRVLKSGDTMTGNLNVEATIVSQNIVPFLDETYDLGTPQKKFRSLYLAGQTIYLGNTTLSTSNDEVIVSSITANTVNVAGYNVQTWISDTTERANLKVQTIQGSLLSVATSNTNNVVVANISIRSANTTQNGVVQLSDSVENTSITLAATANAVNTVYGIADYAANLVDNLSDDLYNLETLYSRITADLYGGAIPAINVAANTVSISANGGSTLSNSKLNFTNTADIIVSVNAGAGAASGNANVGFTLRSIGVSAGTYGDASNVASITVDSAGRVTSVSNVSVIASQAIATAAYDQANAAYDKANVVYDSSNTKIADITSSGNINISNTNVNNVVTYSIGVNDASVSTRGVTKLIDSISSTDSANAATANAVKTAYDLANAALPKAGGTISGDLTVSGNLAVLGDSTVLNVSTIKVEDNEIILNSSVTGSPALNALLTVNRGSSTNVALRWNESTDKWEWTDDGVTYTAFSSIAGSGPQGAAGAQGAQGAQGVQGAAGTNGAQGAQGVQGAAGTNGAQGAQGAQGVQGAAGNDTVPIEINDSAIGTRKTLDFITANSSNLTITGTDDPTNNKVILIFDNPKLGGSGGGVSAYGNTELYISDTPPGSANSNTALWWRANTGKFYIYYNDGDSTQWVSLTPSPIVNTSSNLLFSDANTAASIAAANTLYSEKSNRAGDTFTGNLSVLQNGTKLNISSTLIESNARLTLNASEYKVNTITFSANTASTSAAAQTVVDVVSITDYRTVKYTIQIKNGSSYHATEIMVLHDGTSTYMTEYGTVVTGISLGDFSTDISSGKMRLLFDPVFAVNTLNISRISMPA